MASEKGLSATECFQQCVSHYFKSRSFSTSFYRLVILQNEANIFSKITFGLRFTYTLLLLLPHSPYLPSVSFFPSPFKDCVFVFALWSFIAYLSLKIFTFYGIFCSHFISLAFPAHYNGFFGSEKSFFICFLKALFDN